MRKIEDRSPERILADAICNVLRQEERMTPRPQYHDGLTVRYRGGSPMLGIEGVNGVACENCQRLALKIMAEQRRIRSKVLPQFREGPTKSGVKEPPVTPRPEGRPPPQRKG